METNRGRAVTETHSQPSIPIILGPQPQKHVLLQSLKGETSPEVK